MPGKYLWGQTVKLWFDDLLVESFPPEKAKFKAPLVLLHGVWSDSSCWRLWATHFANLGWDCWAVNLRGRFGARAIEALRRLSFEQCVEDLRRVVRSAPSAPVLLAHGFGGLVAQKAAQEEALAGLVLLSTLPPSGLPMTPTRPLRLLRLKYLPLLWLGKPFRPENKDFQRSWLASIDEDQRDEICRRFVPESGRLAKMFFHRRVGIDPRAVSCPSLVVGGSEDQVVPVAAQRALAERLGADFEVYRDHGHWIIEEKGSQEIVGDIHRWLVQKLGEKILLADSFGPGPGAQAG